MAPPPLSTNNPRVFPFPELPTLAHKDKPLEAFFNYLVRTLRRAFNRGSGASRLRNMTLSTFVPGHVVYVSGDGAVDLASAATGAVGVVNSLNPILPGRYLDVKSVGEYDVAVLAEYAAGTCLYLSATPGSLGNAPGPTAPFACAQVIDSSAYAATGKSRVELLFPSRFVDQA